MRIPVHGWTPVRVQMVEVKKKKGKCKKMRKGTKKIIEGGKV